ncbi:MAG: DUF1295 domain-containing protein [Deltaproteobacteria bacterium]|nr:DUF1295 domain-containing protein [Deltaproteobacteria bacterium]
MDERAVFHWVLWGFAGVGSLLLVTAPYGRHARRGWGPTLSNLWGWLVMEIPAPVGMLVFFLLGGRQGPVEVAFLLIWQLHYCQRTFVFPFLMKPGDPPMPLSIALFGTLFNLFNSYLNGRWLFTLSDPYPATWLSDPRFVAGLAIFLAGFAINLHSDHVLRNLRGPGETGFKIPRRGMFRFVSAANYLGEFTEWVGWAVLTWSWPGAVFAFWTFANLGPRAIATHRWYHRTFPDYPRNRKALIPFVL